MKYLFAAAYAAVAAMLLTVAVPTAAEPAVPADTVRVVQDADSDKVCSAVVIAPNRAVTARHCVSYGMAVDGILVEIIVIPGEQNRDMAVLFVPGLQCPCAEIGGRPVHGTRVVMVGFPSKLEGERRVSQSARVNYIGSAYTIAPWLPPIPEIRNSVYIFTDKAIAESGDSGGALFALQGGKWMLVGVTAIGVPVSEQDRKTEQASGFTPVDALPVFLPRG